jgi:hypothetical protein
VQEAAPITLDMDARAARMGSAVIKLTFDKLQSRMLELKKVLGLEGEDLNLDLGPVGDLL